MDGLDDTHGADAAIRRDLALAARCAGGDHEAWASFLAAHSTRIRHAIRNAITRRGVTLCAEEEDDLYAEALASLIADDYRRLKSYRGDNGCRLGTWVCLVAARLTLNQLTALRRWGTTQPAATDPTPVLTNQPDGRPDAEQILAQRQLIEVVEEAVTTLSIAEQLLVKLCFHHDWSAAEIARFLGITENAVYSRKHRVLQRLRRRLTEPGADSADTSGPPTSATTPPNTTGEMP
jgi:RNA polymerase sigma-70 factor (ECF subfamily)